MTKIIIKPAKKLNVKVLTRNFIAAPATVKAKILSRRHNIDSWIDDNRFMNDLNVEKSRFNSPPSVWLDGGDNIDYFDAPYKIGGKVIATQQIAVFTKDGSTKYMAPGSYGIISDIKYNNGVTGLPEIYFANGDHTTGGPGLRMSDQTITAAVKHVFTESPVTQTAQKVAAVTKNVVGAAVDAGKYAVDKTVKVINGVTDLTANIGKNFNLIIIIVLVVVVIYAYRTLKTA